MENLNDVFRKLLPILQIDSDGANKKIGENNKTGGSIAKQSFKFLMVYQMGRSKRSMQNTIAWWATGKTLIKYQDL